MKCPLCGYVSRGNELHPCGQPNSKERLPASVVSPAQTKGQRAYAQAISPLWTTPEKEPHSLHMTTQPAFGSQNLRADTISEFPDFESDSISFNSLHGPGHSIVPPYSRKFRADNMARKSSSPKFSDLTCGPQSRKTTRLGSFGPNLTPGVFPSSTHNKVTGPSVSNSNLDGAEQIERSTSSDIPRAKLEGPLWGATISAGVPRASPYIALQQKPRYFPADIQTSSNYNHDYNHDYSDLSTRYEINQRGFNPSVDNSKWGSRTLPTTKYPQPMQPQSVRVQDSPNSDSINGFQTDDGLPPHGFSIPNAADIDTKISSLLNSTYTQDVKTSESIESDTCFAEIGVNDTTRLHDYWEMVYPDSLYNEEDLYPSTKVSATAIRQDWEKTAAPRDARYSVISKPEHFFKVGRVFMTLWSEPASSKTHNSPSVSSSELGARIFSETRRFVVMKSNRRCSLCCPIQTYQRRGTTKPGINLKSHARIYKAGTELESLVGEGLQGIGNFPIVMEDRFVTLDKSSVINFGKVYTVEHNIKVRNVGKISKESIPRLKTAFFTSMGMEGSDMETGTEAEAEIEMESKPAKVDNVSTMKNSTGLLQGENTDSDWKIDGPNQEVGWRKRAEPPRRRKGEYRRSSRTE